MELALAHHQRKASAENRRPRTIADVYGSTFIVGGAGSVILLWGDPGDPVVELSHLKPPAEQLEPLTIEIDHQRGVVSALVKTDLLAALRAAPLGLSAREAAARLYESAAPSRAEIEKARRKLEKLAERCLAVRREEEALRGAVREADRYFAAPPEGHQEALD